MAVVADTGWTAYRSDFQGHRGDQAQSGVATSPGICLERRRSGQDGVDALPCVFPVLRGQRKIILSAVSAQRRSVSGRAIQHCLLCLADPDGGASMRPAGRRIRARARGHAPVFQPCGTSSPATRARTAQAAGDETQLTGNEYLRLQIRRFRAGSLRPTSCNQGAGCRVSGRRPGSDEAMRTPRISIIVAMARNGVIGANNALPWHLSADLKRFKSLTMGHHIIMGRKTFQSIGRVLPGRTSVVVTRNPAFGHEGVVTAASVSEAIQRSIKDTEIFVVGGAGIFREALPLATRIHATEIARDYDGDIFFPEFDRNQWQETNSETFS